MELLRFTTAGSVDDGKSTLIGRLLYDSKSIFEDQMEAVKRSSERKGLSNVDLSLLTDGLKAEREQGITIDVAYRYFATPKRKFIIADTPGHIQYTRNMVTGASTANLALILIDARHGVVEQTCRHAYIASLLGIPHLIICVNKMDLVDFQEDVFWKIEDDFTKFATKLGVSDVRFIPISALLGDNVVNRSEKTPWYTGKALLDTLETIQIDNDENHDEARLPVQTVIRPHSNEYHDYRGYAGRIAGGVFRPGDRITVLPSGLDSVVKSIDTFRGPVQEAFAPMSVSVTLEDDIDISRGDLLVKKEDMPEVSREVNCMMCWLNPVAPQPRGKYFIYHGTRELRGLIQEINYKVDINTLEQATGEVEIKMNDIFNTRLKLSEPLAFDRYSKNRNTGSLILVDPTTNETVAAGMII
jgi:sulfate adenylyltransferase subunit 1